MMSRLSEIKSHKKYPFHSYREDPEEYTLSQIYWAEFFKEVCAGVSSEWTDWLKVSDDQSGDSIFSAICENRHRGIIVNQYAPIEKDISYKKGGDYYPFVAWMDVFGDPAYDPLTVHLTINAEISDDLEPFYGRLLKEFVVVGRDRSAMEKLIQEIDFTLYGRFPILKDL